MLEVALLTFRPRQTLSIKRMSIRVRGTCLGPGSIMYHMLGLFPSSLTLTPALFEMATSVATSYRYWED